LGETRNVEGYKIYPRKIKLPLREYLSNIYFLIISQWLNHRGAEELGGEAADLLAPARKSAAYLPISFVPAFDVAQRKQTKKKIK
jgi:hypothetical protein